MSVGHYENFPVASLLCPPALRPPIRAIYAFARTADDIADEGDAPVAQRLADLARYRDALHAAQAGRPCAAWPQVFGPLARQMQAWRLPAPLLHALLDAFEHDAPNPRYGQRSELLAYCAKSANPVGRLLLHLYGISDARSLEQADAICTALQLINFWQDLSVDLPRGRSYLAEADLAAHGLTLAQLQAQGDSPASQAMVQGLAHWAAGLMAQGAPLALRLPGRMGWELRFVVLGGWRILERIRALRHATLRTRPTLAALDVPRLAWRALWLRRCPLNAHAFAPDAANLSPP